LGSITLNAGRGKERAFCGEGFFVAKESLPAPLQESYSGIYFLHFHILIPGEFVMKFDWVNDLVSA